MTTALVPVAPSAPLAIPTSLPPPDRHPAIVYLMRLAPASRRTMEDALAVMAGMLHHEHRERIMVAASTDPKGNRGILLPAKRKVIAETAWWLLGYQHAMAIRSQLSEPPYSLAFSTVNRYLCALRGVARQAFRLGLMSGEDYNRFREVEPIKGYREPAGRMLSDEEIDAATKACDLATARGARDAVVVALTYACGLRRAEVVTRDLVHLDAKAWTVRVLGKGNKERTVPIATSRRNAFEAWLGFRGGAAGPLVHPVNKAGDIYRRRLTSGAVLTILASLGLEAKFSPHDMRRTFVSMLLREGVDLATVQKLAGHASPATTARYDRRGDEAKAKAVELLK